MIKYIFIVIMGMTMATNSSKLYAGELKKATSSAVSILKGSKNVETRDIWVQDFTKIKIMVHIILYLTRVIQVQEQQV